MLCCRASPNDFKLALSWSPAVLSIWRTNDGARMVKRMASTARTPIISISENALWLRGNPVGRVPSRGKQVVFEQAPSQEASQPSDARLQFPSWEGLGVARFKDSPFPFRRPFVNSVFIVI